MRTPTPPAALVLLAVLALARPLTAASVDPADSRRQHQPERQAIDAYDAWSVAAERHEAGQVDAAARAIASWSGEELAKVWPVLDAAQRKTHQKGTLAEARSFFRLVDRGVLLHTDIALSQEGLGGPADRANLLLATDGLRTGVGNTAHLQFAAALLQLNPDRRRSGDPTVRAWYRAVAAQFLHGRRWGEAAVLLSLWRKALLGTEAANPRAFPNDDEHFFLAYGCLHEGLAAPAARAVIGSRMVATSGDGWGAGLEGAISPGARLWTFTVGFFDFTVNLEQAFQAYRRVVEINPAAAEARVRLGRVKCARGNCGSGMRDMRAGADASVDDAVKYYAAMFLGQAQEARGRHDEARQEYERAAALFPRAQSPLLALGALADKTGDRAAASRLASQLWALPAETAQRHDPWWDYDGGPRDGETLIRQAYDLLKGGQDDRQ